MISVLFVAKNSVYKTLTDSAGEPLDCWDEERNALNWAGGNPIVAHPPCRLFSKLRRFSTAPIEEKSMAYWSVYKVREFGGVLEHPSRSALWEDMNLPAPGKRDDFGFSCGVEQWWFGHPAKKSTWLYIVGCNPNDLPDYPFRMGYAEHAIGKCRKRNGLKRSELFDNRKEFRSATPEPFARWLIETAERCKSPELVR
jgi:hypothetical protein